MARTKPPAFAPHVILASSSPRRIEFLRKQGLDPIIVAPNVDETPLPRESAAKMVARLARAKAQSVAARALQNTDSDAYPWVIVAADTTVVLNGKILGKPESRQDAFKMLARLSGQTHTVLTAYALVYAPTPGRLTRKSRVVKTQVTMRKLSRHAIESYIASGEPMDKAGSYGAQGLGMSLIASINGSYTNVVGLPIAQLLEDLETLCGKSVLEAPR